jgi:hypothetical protein
MKRGRGKIWTEVPIRIMRLAPNVFARSSGFYSFGNTRPEVETARLFYAVLVEGHRYEHSVADRKNRLRLNVSCCDSWCCAVRLELNGMGCARIVGHFAIIVREAISQCRDHKRGRSSVAEERGL